MNEEFQVLLYYLYTRIENPVALAEEQRARCESLGLLGRILVGAEGINGTVSGTVESTEAYMQAMRDDPLTVPMEFKVDAVEGHVFPRLTVKSRPEIVSLGLPRRGTHSGSVENKEQHRGLRDACAAQGAQKQYLKTGRRFGGLKGLVIYLRVPEEPGPAGFGRRVEALLRWPAARPVLSTCVSRKRPAPVVRSPQSPTRPRRC